MKRINLNTMSLDNLQTKMETLSETSLYGIQGGEWKYIDTRIKLTEKIPTGIWVWVC